MGPIGEESVCHMMSNVQVVTQLGDKPYTKMKTMVERSMCMAEEECVKLLPNHSWSYLEWVFLY